MRARRVTPGSLARTQWERAWDTIIPVEVLAIGLACREAIQRVSEGPAYDHDPAVDWETLYQRPRARVAGGFLSILLGRQRPVEALSSVESDAQLDGLVRQLRPALQSFDDGEAVTREVGERLAEHLKERLKEFGIEIRVAYDNVAAVLLFRCPLPLLMQKAMKGDLRALGQVLHINPALESRKWAQDLLVARARSDGIRGGREFQAAVAEGAKTRRRKLQEVGGLLALLWPFLRRLTTNQRGTFLREIECSSVPSKKALREYERRLGLKALIRE